METCGYNGVKRWYKKVSIQESNKFTLKVILLIRSKSHNRICCWHLLIMEDSTGHS